MFYAYVYNYNAKANNDGNLQSIATLITAKITLESA